MKHTGNIWETVQVYESDFNQSGKVEIRAIDSDGLPITTIAEIATGIPESKSNANLIAAAPEMLKALQMIADCIAEGRTPWTKEFKAINAAIEKAIN